MTAKTLKPYPKYKDSGVSWIGMVPQGWEVKFLQQVAKEKCIKNKNNIINIVLSLSYGNIIMKADINQGLSPKDYATYQIVNPGDVILRLTDLQNDHRSLRTGLVKNLGIITSAYLCLFTSENSSYLHYLLHTVDILKLFYGMGAGVRQSMKFDDLRHFSIPLPPRPEQDAIVAYLDDKTAKIDRLIGLYKREIELLKERRQAVIHQAVTRGLDDKVKLKDSGVSWIGMVPVGWGVSTVGHLFNSFLGKMLEQSSNSSQPNSEYKPYICAKDVHFDGVDITDSKLMKFNRQEIQKYSVKRGDLLIVEGGAGAGGSAIYNYNDERMVQNSIHVVRNRGFLLNKYLYYWMYSLVSRNYIDAVCNKATIPHFTGEKLSATMIPLPPRSEQDAIVAYLDDQCAKVDTMIGKVQSKIGLLEEYRVRLISDVVTGKVRV